MADNVIGDIGAVETNPAQHIVSNDIARDLMPARTTVVHDTGAAIAEGFTIDTDTNAVAFDRGIRHTTRTAAKAQFNPVIQVTRNHVIEDFRA